MDREPLYPLFFEPILQPRLWGGRRLGEFLGRPLPSDEPFGEAWVLSDQGDHPTRVANGPLAGRNLRQLMEEMGDRILGDVDVPHGRFPLLLKFLDARDTLSVQVHPDDSHTHLLPPGQRGKTEAWVVLDAAPGSRIYAGLKPGLDAGQLRQALTDRTMADCLTSFAPRQGDCVFLRAGTVHALGGGVVLFEVQQNSDVTFRLYDWDRLDAQGNPRQLHIEQALDCTDYAAEVSGPALPVVEAQAPVLRERLVSCDHFQLWRLRAGPQSFEVGAAGQCRILVGVEGGGQLRHGGETYSVKRGDVVLLPAEVGACSCRAAGAGVFLECAIKE
jgi:mannose-6-phosphate isomerase